MKNEVDAIMKYTKQSFCEHPVVDYDWDSDNNHSPFIVSAVCEDCGKDIVDELSNKELVELQYDRREQDLESIYGY